VCLCVCCTVWQTKSFWNWWWWAAFTSQHTITPVLKKRCVCVCVCVCVYNSLSHFEKRPPPLFHPTTQSRDWVRAGAVGGRSRDVNRLTQGCGIRGWGGGVATTAIFAPFNVKGAFIHFFPERQRWSWWWQRRYKMLNRICPAVVWPDPLPFSWISRCLVTTKWSKHKKERKSEITLSRTMFEKTLFSVKGQSGWRDQF